jgi:hypothetical protein
MSEEQYIETIKLWLEYQSRQGNGIPDFWNELNTTESLAEWLYESQ